MSAPDLLSATEPSVLALAARARLLGVQLATAESCTGGLIAGACTAVAGSSDWFERGIVSYSNQAKTDLLGVPAELIDAEGAVSEAVARAMAEGLLARCPSPVRLSLAVTGVAGPGGGSALKPVGTVWLGWAVRTREGALRVHARLLQLDGDRAAVRQQTVQAALDQALDALDALNDALC